MVEEALSLDQIFEMEILMDLHALRPPESENQIYRGWYQCEKIISITKKHIKQKIQIWYSTFVSWVEST